MRLFDIQKFRGQFAEDTQRAFYTARNYALLGMSEEKLKQRWHPSVDVGNLREVMLEGYHSPELPESENCIDVVRHYDGKFLMNMIASGLKDWEDRGYTEVHSEGDTYFIMGVGSSYYKLFVHKRLRIAVMVRFSNMIYTEGADDSHYSLKIGYVLDCRNSNISRRMSHEVERVARRISVMNSSVPEIRYCGGSHRWQGSRPGRDCDLEIVGASFEFNHWKGGHPGVKGVVNTLNALAKCLETAYTVYKGHVPLKDYLPFVLPSHVHKAYDDKQFWPNFRINESEDVE